MLQFSCRSEKLREGLFMDVFNTISLKDNSCFKMGLRYLSP